MDAPDDDDVGRGGHGGGCSEGGSEGVKGGAWAGGESAREHHTTVSLAVYSCIVREEDE